MVWCDFCGSRQAILYCRADTAQLCLWCDQQVHSANALSKKHLRSQICDSCAAQPASFRCSTDGDSFSGSDGGCGGDREDLEPGTPRREQDVQQEFTSLLLMPTPPNHNTTTACMFHIWDFNLGQLRGHEESSPVELEFGGSDMYTMKSYGEASLAKRRVVDISGVNCSVAKEDIIPFHSRFLAGGGYWLLAS
ncbi:zinc finger protein CONSTANS-LIKE 1-like [Salvia hispanica]|uniref:zinc finger protein CONSTANS-LIKE 1-like n=1 Tax=Salvia hispanica TaxID=49212 RepID=UPI002009A91C|nr:zinc finger protein CONSTANS-LIKE 1-like [Salvia hispanica]